MYYIGMYVLLLTCIATRQVINEMKGPPSILYICISHESNDYLLIYTTQYYFFIIHNMFEHFQKILLAFSKGTRGLKNQFFNTQKSEKYDIIFFSNSELDSILTIFSFIQCSIPNQPLTSADFASTASVQNPEATNPE